MPRILAAFVMFFFCAGSNAQTLSDRVPADAMVYVGWRGTLDLGPNYAGSHAAAIAKQSSVTRVIDESLPELVKYVATREPDAAKVAETVRLMLTSAIRHPMAAYVSPGDEQSRGMPRVGIVVRPGKDAPKLLQELQQLAQQAPRSVRLKAFAVDDVVAVVFGYDDDQMALAGAGGGRPDALANDAAFKAAIARVDAEAVVTLYLNPRAVVDNIKSTMPQRDLESPEGQKVQMLLRELGLDAVGSVAWTGTFNNQNWRQRLFVDAKEKRGLLSLLEAKPFNTDLMSRVPASATSVSAARFDPHKLFQEARRASKATDPAWGNAVAQGIGAMTLAIGANFEDDILAPLGDEWIVYNSPEVAGGDLFGTVIVNKLDKPLDAKTGLASLSIFLSNTGRTFTRNQDFKLSGQMIRVEDMNVYYCATPLIAPAWTVKDGYLYVGFYPQSVVAAAKYKGPGIAENAKFAEAMTRLEQTNVVLMSFDDVKAKLPDGYGTLRLLSRGLLGASDMYAVKTPEMLLPPLPTLLAEAGPAGSVVWMDESGIHMQSVESFPGSTVLANASLTNATPMYAGLTTSILLPSLNRARETANRVKSASNLRQIGIACMLYANDNNGKLPVDLSTILQTQDLIAEVFINPRTGTAVPPVPPGQNRVDFHADWVNTGSDYVYLGAGNVNQMGPNRVLAYERPEGLDDGINILFGDTRVEWVPFPRVPQVFKDAGQEPPPMPHR